MIKNIATISRVSLAFVFLTTVTLGTPLMPMPQALGGAALAMIMAYVDLWCMQRMRRSDLDTRSLLSETMLLVAAISILAASIGMTVSEGRGSILEMLLGLVAAWLAWRCRTVLRHLRDGTVPEPRSSGIEDSKRMIADLRRRLDGGSRAPREKRSASGSTTGKTGIPEDRSPARRR